MIAEKQATQIAMLLNIRNELTKEYTAADILKSNNKQFFLIESDSVGNVIGVIEIFKVQWYQCEIRHLSVNEKFEGKGVGKKLAQAAISKAKEWNAGIAQCTIREDNLRSQSLFIKNGFIKVNTFINVETGNNVFVYQLDLTK